MAPVNFANLALILFFLKVALVITVFALFNDFVEVNITFWSNAFGLIATLLFNVTFFKSVPLNAHLPIFFNFEFVVNFDTGFSANAYGSIVVTFLPNFTSEIP